MPLCYYYVCSTLIPLAQGDYLHNSTLHLQVLRPITVGHFACHTTQTHIILLRRQKRTTVLGGISFVYVCNEKDHSCLFCCTMHGADLPTTRERTADYRVSGLARHAGYCTRAWERQGRGWCSCLCLVARLVAVRPYSACRHLGLVHHTLSFPSTYQV